MIYCTRCDDFHPEGEGCPWAGTCQKCLWPFDSEVHDRCKNGELEAGIV